MAHCKYHPLDAATYHCEQCDIHLCNHCIHEETRLRSAPTCHLCESKLDHLGDGASADPFWRRLEQAFRYPLSGNALSIIIPISIISSLISYIPSIFAFIAVLALFGAMLKYAFICLENTATGNMVAPDIHEAYQGGLGLVFQLFLMVLSLLGTFAVLAIYVNVALASFVGIVFVISFPAMLIRFSETQNIFESTNPLRAIQLISAIGLPYGVLIAFIMIMISSVGIINELIGNFSIVSVMLQSIVSNYYLVVSFHIMGYMLFQYQDRLGYTAKADYGEENTTRSNKDITNSKIQVFLKEGDYDKVVQLFSQAFKDFPKEYSFVDDYFEFIYQTKNKRHIDGIANLYLKAVIERKQFDKLNLAYKRTKEINPNFLPDSPEIRYEVAVACKAKGDSASVVKLINGLHKQYPNFVKLGEAYRLMANALYDLPNMEKQATQCKALADKFSAEIQKKKAKEDESQKDQVPTKPINPFEPRDLTSTEMSRHTTNEKPDKMPEKEEEAEPEAPKDLPPIEFK